ncbi:unnamed protein product, partial [Prorocentrum cordatum]
RAARLPGRQPRGSRGPVEADREQRLQALRGQLDERREAVSAELQRARQRRGKTADQPEEPQLPGGAERQVLLAQLRACRSEADASREEMEAEAVRLRQELCSCREEHAEFRLAEAAEMDVVASKAFAVKALLAESRAENEARLRRCREEAWAAEARFESATEEARQPGSAPSLVVECSRLEKAVEDLRRRVERFASSCGQASAIELGLRRPSDPMDADVNNLAALRVKLLRLLELWSSEGEPPEAATDATLSPTTVNASPRRWPQATATERTASPTSASHPAAVPPPPAHEHAA